MNDDDLFEKVKKQEKSGFTFTISPLILHISVLILLGLVIYFVFLSDSSIIEDEDVTLVLIGEVENFSKNYEGDIELYSAFYSLKTSNGEFDGENTDFSLTNFSGVVFLENNSLQFRGSSPEVTFGSNKLNLENEIFTLTSKTKTTFELSINELDLEFIEGRIKFAEELNNDFTNTSIMIKNYNTSITYDGKFSFKGVSESFNVNNNDRNLRIIYNE